MESKRFEIPKGAGASLPDHPISPVLPASEVCQHVTERGHRCHMLSKDGSGLCVFHSRRRFQRAPDGRSHASITDDTAAELLGEIDDFDSPAAVNLFLGNLVKQVVRKRVTRRDAIALAYLSQLILNSLSAMSREQILKQEARPRVNIVMDGIMSPDFGPERERRPNSLNANRPENAGLGNGGA